MTKEVDGQALLTALTTEHFPGAFQLYLTSGAAILKAATSATTFSFHHRCRIGAKIGATEPGAAEYGGGDDDLGGG